MTSMDHTPDDDVRHADDTGYGTPETLGDPYDTRRPAHRAESDDEADRIRSDDLVEPAELTGVHDVDTGMRTEADRIRSDDIAADRPYAGVTDAGYGLTDDGDGLTDADRLRARGIDDEPEVIALGVGDEDALLSDAEKIQARDIDQS